MAACTCADPTAVAQAVSNNGSTISGSISAAAASETLQQEYMHKTMYGLLMGGLPGAWSPQRFCHWLAPEISDIGENGWSLAFQAASIAIAAANGVAQAEIASKQQELADGWYQQAKFKWDRFAGKYMPLEKKLLNEVSTTPVRQLDCAGAENRALTSVNSAYDGAGNYLSRKARAMRLCIDPSLLSMINFKRAVMETDAENYNLADDQWFTDVKNDQRWNRRSNILNLGRNLSSEALKYGDVARQLYGQVGQQIERAAYGVMQALGYYGARNDTYYPTSFLSGQGGQVVSIGQPIGANPAVSTNPTGG